MTTDATSQITLEVVTDELVRLGAERDAVTPEAKLTDIDVDSLDLAELAQIVDDKYGVTITTDDMKTIKNVGDVLDIIAARA